MAREGKGKGGGIGVMGGGNERLLHAKSCPDKRVCLLIHDISTREGDR